jgi:membrane protein YfhO
MIARERLKAPPGLPAYAVVLAAVLAASGWVLTRPTPLALGADNATLTHPLLADAARQVRAGAAPIWTIGRWGGSPLAADAVVGALYPPYHLAYDVTSLPHARALDLVVLGHAALFSTGLVWCFGGLAVGPLAAATATLLALASPTFVHVARTWVQYWSALAWWPWLLGAVVRLAATRRAAWGLVAAASLAAQVYAGYPQFALYSGTIALAVLVLHPAVRGVTGLLLALAVGVVAVGFAAPQLLPGVALAADTTRRGPDAAAALAALDAFALGGRDWLAVPMPGPISPALPCKVAPAALALALVGAATRAFVPRALAVATVVAALLATAHLPLFRLLHSVPPFDVFAGPVKLFYVAAFLVHVLAGLGLAATLDTIGRRSRVAALALVVAVLASGASFLASTRALVAPPVQTGGAFARLLALGPRAVNVERHATRWLALTADPTLRQVGLNYGALWDVGSLNGVGPLPAWRQIAVMEHAERGAAPALVREVGADLVVVPAASPLEAELLAAGFSGPPARDGLRALAPAATPPRYALAALGRAVGADEAIAAARAGRAIGDDDVLLEASPEGARWEGDPLGVLTAVAERPTAARLRVRVDRPTWLVARDAYRGGWRATVDGRAAAIVPAAGFFMGVLVPAGTHDVTVVYEEPLLRTGLVVLLLTTALAPAWLARLTARAA